MPCLARTGTEPASMVTVTAATAAIARTTLFMRTSLGGLYGGSLHARGFPAAAPENGGAGDGQDGKCDGNRPERAGGAQPDRPRQHVGQRDFEQPETEQVQERRRQRISGAVERLRQHD